MSEGGWNRKKDAYVCEDGIRVKVKRQSSGKVTREQGFEQVKVAIVPINGVSFK